MLNGRHVFLAHFTAKKAEDKLEEKRLEDVPILRYFPKPAHDIRAHLSIKLRRDKDLPDLTAYRASDKGF
ncbi:hypothetical protein Tco_1131416 [Tanacetum coccineum]